MHELLCSRPYSQVSEIVAVSARFTLQLASFHEADSSKALTAITDFLTFVVTVYSHKLTLPFVLS